MRRRPIFRAWDDLGLFYHRARCHCCGAEFLLETYRPLHFPIRWPDGRIAHTCLTGESMIHHRRLMHKMVDIREAYQSTFVRGEGEKVIEAESG